MKGDIATHRHPLADAPHKRVGDGFYGNDGYQNYPHIKSDNCILSRTVPMLPTRSFGTCIAIVTKKANL
jgi:hypothetical protein